MNYSFDWGVIALLSISLAIMAIPGIAFIAVSIQLRKRESRATCSGHSILALGPRFRGDERRELSRRACHGARAQPVARGALRSRDLLRTHFGCNLATQA